MQSRTVRRITSEHAAFSLHSHTTRHRTARPSSPRLVGLSASVRRQIQLLQQRHPHADRSQSTPDPTSTTSPERFEDMCPSRSCRCPHLALLLSLMLFAGLAGCGPVSSDNAPNLESRAAWLGHTTGQRGDRQR
jgi:hypothetical protein